MRRWLLAAGAGVVVVLLVVGGVVAWNVVTTWQRSGDVRGSTTAEFVPTEAPEPPAKPHVRGVAWPQYGFNEERLRAVAFRVRPPFRRLWGFGARTLVERVDAPPPVADVDEPVGDEW